MDKLIIVGQVPDHHEVAELPQPGAYLLDGWRIKKIQAMSSKEHCCYVWLTKKNQKYPTMI